MHRGEKGLITIRGHTLTVLEGHAIAYGAVGIFAALHPEMSEAIEREFPYILGSFLITFLVGRLLKERST